MKDYRQPNLPPILMAPIEDVIYVYTEHVAEFCEYIIGRAYFISRAKPGYYKN